MLGALYKEPKHSRRVVVEACQIGREQRSTRVDRGVDESILRLASRVESGRRRANDVLVETVEDERVLSLGTLAVVEPAIRVLRLRAEL